MMKPNICKTKNMKAATSNMPSWLFVLWAGGTALLSYSLVYALRKPFTAAEFEGMEVAGMDYKIVTSIIQLVGYVCAKLLGIKYISELKPEGRLKFIIGSAALSEVSLLAFGLLPTPYNICALFFNGEITDADVPDRFFESNCFYTTAASRISRHIYKGCVTCDQVVRLCRENEVIE